MDEWIELDAMEIRQEERSARPQEPPTPRNMLGKQKIKRGNECLEMDLYLAFHSFRVTMPLPPPESSANSG